MTKAILTGVILGLVLLVTGYGQTPTVTPFDANVIDYSQFTPGEIAATEAHLDQLKGVVRGKLDTIVTTSDRQGFALADAKKAFEDYRLATEVQIERGNKAIAALDHVLKKLHLAKIIANALLLGIVAFVAIKIPPPIGIYAAGAVMVAGTAAIWVFL